jgi:hypothetical protein
VTVFSFQAAKPDTWPALSTAMGASAEGKGVPGLAKIRGVGVAVGSGVEVAVGVGVAVRVGNGVEVDVGRGVNEAVGGSVGVGRGVGEEQPAAARQPRITMVAKPNEGGLIDISSTSRLAGRSEEKPCYRQIEDKTRSSNGKLSQLTSRQDSNRYAVAALFFTTGLMRTHVWVFTQRMTHHRS